MSSSVCSYATKYSKISTKTDITPSSKSKGYYSQKNKMQNQQESKLSKQEQFYENEIKHRQVMLENQRRRKEKEQKLKEQAEKQKLKDIEALEQRKKSKQESYLKYLRNQQADNMLKQFKSEKNQLINSKEPPKVQSMPKKQSQPENSFKINNSKKILTQQDFENNHNVHPNSQNSMRQRQSSARKTEKYSIEGLDLEMSQVNFEKVRHIQKKQAQKQDQQQIQEQKNPQFQGQNLVLEFERDFEQQEEIDLKQSKLIESLDLTQSTLMWRGPDATKMKAFQQQFQQNQKGADKYNYDIPKQKQKTNNLVSQNGFKKKNQNNDFDYSKQLNFQDEEDIQDIIGYRNLDDSLEMKKEPVQPKPQQPQSSQSHKRPLQQKKLTQKNIDEYQKSINNTNKQNYLSKKMEDFQDRQAKISKQEQKKQNNNNNNDDDKVSFISSSTRRTSSINNRKQQIQPKQQQNNPSKQEKQSSRSIQNIQNIKNNREQVKQKENQQLQEQHKTITFGKKPNNNDKTMDQDIQSQSSKFKSKLQQQIEIDKQFAQQQQQQKHQQQQLQQQPKRKNSFDTSCTRDVDIDIDEFIKDDLINLNKEEKEIQQNIMDIHVQNMDRVRQIQCKNNIKLDYKNTEQLLLQQNNKGQNTENNEIKSLEEQKIYNESMLQQSLLKLDNLLAKKGGKNILTSENKQQDMSMISQQTQFHKQNQSIQSQNSIAMTPEQLVLQQQQMQIQLQQQQLQLLQKQQQEIDQQNVQLRKLNDQYKNESNMEQKQKQSSKNLFGQPKCLQIDDNEFTSFSKQIAFEDEQNDNSNNNILEDTEELKSIEGSHYFPNEDFSRQIPQINDDTISIQRKTHQSNFNEQSMNTTMQSQMTAGGGKFNRKMQMYKEKTENSMQMSNNNNNNTFKINEQETQANQNQNIKKPAQKYYQEPKPTSYSKKNNSLKQQPNIIKETKDENEDKIETNSQLAKLLMQ